MAEVTCSACGYVIKKDPQEAIHDPDGDAPSNPDAHIWINHGSKGPRFHCSELGQMTSITAGVDGETVVTPKQYYEKLGLDTGSSQEEGGPSNQGDSGQNDRPNSGGTTPDIPQQRKEPGLDLDEDIEAMDILTGILSNPLYELSDPQIREVLSWAEEFEDGMIPPDSLEELLGLLEGISKQKAQLMRQKYEVKIQNWMRKRSQDDSGPPVGALGRRSGPSPSRLNIANRRESSTSMGGGGGGPTARDIQEEDTEPDRVIDRRRQKAQDRVDEFADEFLSSFASNVGDDAGRFYSDIRNIVITALNKKAERDPDWVIEKLEGVGGFEIINELMETSDTKKREDAVKQAQPSVDAEVDEAIESLSDMEPEHQTQPQTASQTQQPQSHTNQPESNKVENFIDDGVEDEKDAQENEGEKEMFEETFGQIGSE